MAEKFLKKQELIRKSNHDFNQRSPSMSSNQRNNYSSSKLKNNGSLSDLQTGMRNKVAAQAYQSVNLTIEKNAITENQKSKFLPKLNIEKS